MPRADILRSVAIVRSPRVMQLEGMFDLPVSAVSEHRITADLALPDEWNVGVIVGPSGSGKSTVAAEMFGANMIKSFDWPKDRSVIDGFPPTVGIKDITALLSSVGFSSPPAWLRPFHVLSNGEQFRVTMARAMAENAGLIVVDEFTSVIDRTVAKIGSAAIAKTIRRRKQQFIAVSCHYDILDWLEPDWVFQPHTGQFELTRGRLRRPQIAIEIRRVHRSAWRLFQRHHYLSTEIANGAQCFVAFVEGQPAAFTSYIHFPHPSDARYKREHRTVVLPDFQGVGLGNRLSEWQGAHLTSEGWRFISTTSHPAMIRHRYASPLWRVNRKLGRVSPRTTKATITGNLASSGGRFTAGFEYVGGNPSADSTRHRQADLVTSLDAHPASHPSSSVVRGDSERREDAGVSRDDGLLAQATGGADL